jgi:hypothetical protein
MLQSEPKEWVNRKEIFQLIFFKCFGIPMILTDESGWIRMIQTKIGEF